MLPGSGLYEYNPWFYSYNSRVWRLPGSGLYEYNPWFYSYNNRVWRLPSSGLYEYNPWFYLYNTRAWMRPGPGPRHTKLSSFPKKCRFAHNSRPLRGAWFFLFETFRLLVKNSFPLFNIKNARIQPFFTLINSRLPRSQSTFLGFSFFS
jgi:hypothetical protein